MVVITCVHIPEIWHVFLHPRRRHHHHHLANLQLVHLLNRSDLHTSRNLLIVSPGFFYFLVCRLFIFPWTPSQGVLFIQHVATICFCIPVFCPKLVLRLNLLQSRGTRGRSWLGSALQFRKSRVLFYMSLEFFLPAALWPWGRFSL